MFNVVDLSEIAILAMHHMQNREFANIGAGVGGGFKNAKELKVMNYNQAVNGPDGVRWRAEVENEYQPMLTNKVFEVLSEIAGCAACAPMHSLLLTMCLWMTALT